jgi:hypothetical protein
MIATDWTETGVNPGGDHLSGQGYYLAEINGRQVLMGGPDENQDGLSVAYQMATDGVYRNGTLIALGFRFKEFKYYIWTLTIGGLASVAVLGLLFWGNAT